MTIPQPTPIKIKLHNKSTSFIPKDLISNFSVKPGQLVITNSSRIHSDMLLPSVYLGEDPSNNRKHIFLCLPKLFIHVPSIEDEFNIFGSISVRCLRINWEVEDIKINRIISVVSQMITGKDSFINLDQLIQEL